MGHSHTDIHLEVGEEITFFIPNKYWVDVCGCSLTAQSFYCGILKRIVFSFGGECDGKLIVYKRFFGWQKKISEINFHVRYGKPATLKIEQA